MSASVKAVDFSNVKEGGNFNKKRIPAGDYLAKIVKVEDAKAKDDIFQYLFTIQIVKRPGSRFPFYCKLQENQLWKLRSLFIAAGKSVPKSKIKVDPNQLIGKTIGVTISDSEYVKDGDTIEQSEIDGVFPAADLEDDDSEPEEDEAEEEEDEDDDLDLNSDDDEEDEEDGDEWDAITDRTELRRALKRVAPDVKTSSSQSEDDIRNLIRQAVAAAGEEDEEEEDEEPEPAPKKKAKPAAKAPAKKTKKKSADVDDDDLEDLDIDEL